MQINRKILLDKEITAENKNNIKSDKIALPVTNIEVQQNKQHQ